MKTSLIHICRDVLVEIVSYIPESSADAACLKLSCPMMYDLLSNKLAYPHKINTRLQSISLYD